MSVWREMSLRHKSKEKSLVEGELTEKTPPIRPQFKLRAISEEYEAFGAFGVIVRTEIQHISIFGYTD